MDLRKLQRVIIDALEDVKAQDIRVYDTTKLSELFDRVIIATGSSNRQTRSLAMSVKEEVNAKGGEVISIEGLETGEWSGWGFYEKLSSHDIERHDPALIQVVEQLGKKKASGNCADLDIIEIPDFKDETISTYGLKYIAEDTGCKSGYIFAIKNFEGKFIGSLGLDFTRKKTKESKASWATISPLMCVTMISAYCYPTTT